VAKVEAPKQLVKARYAKIMQIMLDWNISTPL